MNSICSYGGILSRRAALRPLREPTMLPSATLLIYKLRESGTLENRGLLFQRFIRIYYRLPTHRKIFKLPRIAWLVSDVSCKTALRQNKNKDLRRHWYISQSGEETMAITQLSQAHTLRTSAAKSICVPVKSVRVSCGDYEGRSTRDEAFAKSNHAEKGAGGSRSGGRCGLGERVAKRS